MPPDNTRDEIPLALTVHSMPEPQQIGKAMAARTRGGRWKMLAVLLVCAAPVLASYFTYYVVRPDGRRNFGELINPQRALPDLAATQVDGRAVNLRGLKGQWLLVSVGSGSCDEACTQHLYLQRQLREALGREKDRLDWVWLVNDAVPIADTLLPGLTAATVLRVPPMGLAQWLQPQEGSAIQDHLYLVDPYGNWMMRFPPTLNSTTAAKARRDLERLLRASNAWDKAGR